MYIVARYRDKKYEVSMRKSYREKGVVKKKEIYLMTYKLYWLNCRNIYPQIERDYLPQFDNISKNAQKYFEEDDNLMEQIINKIVQKEKERKNLIDTKKQQMDEENKKFREQRKSLLNCGWDE